MPIQKQDQQPDNPQGQRHKEPAWLRWSIIAVGLLLSIAGATVWILYSSSPWINILPAIIFTILGIAISLFQWLFPLSPKMSDHTLGAVSVPQIVVQMPPIHPSPPLLTPPQETGYRGIVGFPPLTDPRTIQQRENTVKGVYARLIQSDTTAIVLTGIGGVGKSTLAALVYHYAEEERRSSRGPFKAQALWLTIDSAVTMSDLGGNLFEALGKPMPNFNNLSLQNQVIALFNALNTVEEPRFIILDQFENLLTWQTGHVLAERAGVGEWLDALNSLSCRCRFLLTSRPWPHGSREFPPTYMQEYPVKGLEITEGIELLRKQGLEAPEDELRAVVLYCEGHAFALVLLASLLRRNRSLSLTTLFKDQIYAQLWMGDIASNLLDFIYTQQLNEVERKLLIAFSVYREPVQLAAARTLADFTADTSIQQIQVALNTLLNQHLIQASGEGCYQLHALVASYVQNHFVEGNEKSNQQAMRGAHVRAARYYLQQAIVSCPPRERRQRINDVHHFIEAIWHQCQAEQWQAAYDLIHQEGIFSDLKRWGSNAILLELLLPLDKWHPERSKAALICNNLGRVYSALGQKEQALEHYEQALGIYRELRDRNGEGRTLNNLGSVYNVLGKRERAREYLEQALSICRLLGDRELEGKTLNNLGALNNDLGYKERALECYQQALTICIDIGYRRGEGKTLSNLGRVYDDLGQKVQALAYYERALSIHKEVGGLRGEGRTLNNVAVVYTDLGYPIKAQESYQQALSICKLLGDRRGEGTVLANLGVVYAHLGHKGEAQKYYLQALDIYKEIGDPFGEGRTFNNLGVTYYVQGKMEEAQEYYEMALHIYRDIGDREGRGTVFHNLGALCNGLGKKEEAMKYYLDALRIYKEVGDLEGEGRSLNNLGVVHADLGHKEEAQKYYLQSLKINREVGDLEGEGSVLHNLGMTYIEEGHYKVALACFVLAKNKFEYIKSPKWGIVQSYLDDLRTKLGEEHFIEILIKINLQALHLVNQAIGDFE